MVFPIGEEILFRGIIQSMANYLMGGNLVYIPMPIFNSVTVQVFISAFCFGITHFQYFDFRFNSSSLKKVLFAFVFGLFAGNIVEITGSIFYTILFHILGNSIAAICYVVKTKEGRNLTN